MLIICTILFAVVLGFVVFSLLKSKNPNDNKNKKSNFLIIAIVIVSFIGIEIILLTIFNLKYEIIYYDELSPGSRYDISVQENNKVKITTTRSCSAIAGKPTTEKFDYSKDNLEKLKLFINNNFSHKYVKVYDHELTDRQKEVIQGLLLGEHFFEANVEEYKYKIEYDKNDSLTYDIYFKNDNSILVKKLKNNSDYDIVSIDTYSLNFSQKNKTILNDYIEKEVKKENKNIIYKHSTLQKDEINIFNSIVENNESYLNNIENEAKLAYTVS